MMSGTVNRHLLPIIPIGVRREDEEWQPLEILLDTGFNGDIALDRSLMNQYQLQTRPDYDRLSSKGVLRGRGESTATTPCAVELLWNGLTRMASLEQIGDHPFSGMVGTGLLSNYRVVVDVVENGAVTVDYVPSSSYEPRFQWPWKRRRRKRQLPSMEYLEWWLHDLPWTNLEIQDGWGNWQTLSVNVDTGSSEELSLPADWVARLGFRLAGKSQLQTVDGPVEVRCGEVEVMWKGRRQRIECTQREDNVPPVIGMKLFHGNRITFDVDFRRQAVGIVPLSRLRSWKGRFLQRIPLRTPLK